ncbi:MAG: hypothetical protein GZ091_01205 [Paludibacter sp.]|nr:hypothetical protein [Paludibacter sp.]
MYKNKNFSLVISLFFLIQIVSSQNNTNSPYTRFGFGELSDTNSGEQRAMGGVSIGARASENINTVNPASYSVVDSMTFMFDIGSSALVSRFSDPTGGKTTFNANIEYITMQFPLYKWMGFSAGLLPYSFSGYNFFTNDTASIPNNNAEPSKIAYTKNFNGVGGFSQVYTGLSVNLFNHLSLGINAYYMYGSVNNYRNISFANTSGFQSTTQLNSISANNFRFRFGAQFYNTFATKHDITLGVIYEQKAKLNGNFTQINSGVLTDTVNVSGSNDFEMPTIYGLGLYYTFDKKLSVGIDYSMQGWKAANFFGKTDSLCNRSKIALGLEYLPDIRSRKFSDKIRYRAGFNLSDAYYKVDGVTLPKNFGISFGLGLPLYNKVSNTTSMLNTSFEYGKIGSNTMLREDYFKFTLNIVFNEHWFFKRKL